MQTFIDFLSSKYLIPHGYCLNWNLPLLWMHVGSDLLIALAYYSIPISLAYFANRRKDLPYPRLFLLFQLFILACGTTHLLSAVMIWIPIYWLDGYVKVFMAVVSMMAAVLMFRIIPQALQVPSAAQLQAEIAQRKLAEQALRDSETKFRTLYNSSSDALILLDKQGFFDCNPACLLMFGCHDKNELCSKNPAELSPPTQACGTDSVTLANQHIAKALAEGSHRFEWLHKRVDSNILFPAEILLNAMEINDKWVIQCVIRDISERKRAELQRQENESRLNLSQEYGGIGSWEADLIHNTQIWSKTTCQLVGFPQIPNPTWEDFLSVIHPDDRQMVIDAHQAHLTEGKKYDVEYRVIFADGQPRWMRSIGRAEYNADGIATRFIGIVQDITERKLMEAELKRSNADLEQFAYAISHDMRQPLRMVTSYLSLIENALAQQLDEEQQQFLNFAIDGAKRMDDMILSLLDYSRVGHKNAAIRQTSSRTALNEALDFLEPERQLNNGIINISGDWQELMINPDELTRLLQNLIGNALKYHEKDQPPHIEVHGECNAVLFKVTVSDDGIGIDQQHFHQLFKVFSRLQPRSRFEGTGIGLALCRKIVESYGGKIGVESKGEGHGCVFWFELPLQPINVEPTI